MSKRDPLLLIEDIIESVVKIERYIGEMDYSEFIVDEKTKDAVIRNFFEDMPCSIQIPAYCCDIRV